MRFHVDPSPQQIKIVHGMINLKMIERFSLLGYVPFKTEVTKRPLSKFGEIIKMAKLSANSSQEYYRESRIAKPSISQSEWKKCRIQWKRLEIRAR